MARDYRSRASTRSRRGNRGSGFFWFVTGVVVGAFGVGLAWTMQDAERSAPGPAVAKPEQRPAAKPRFDFYNILPEMEVVVPDEDLAAKPPPLPPKPQKADPAAQPAQPNEALTQTPPAATADGSYLLQVASYRNVTEAERLKAQLALSGIQAQIQQVTINGKDTYHRVRAGPYRDKDAINQARAQLSRKGLESITIKLK
jgi:cell division protein FtsN